MVLIIVRYFNYWKVITFYKELLLGKFDEIYWSSWDFSGCSEEQSLIQWESQISAHPHFLSGYCSSCLEFTSPLPPNILIKCKCHPLVFACFSWELRWEGKCLGLPHCLRAVWVRGLVHCPIFNLSVPSCSSITCQVWLTTPEEMFLGCLISQLTICPLHMRKVFLQPHYNQEFTSSTKLWSKLKKLYYK